MKEKEFEEKLVLLDHLQSACTHCGLCSEACATFQATGWEHESPRGRLHLASQFLHGNIHPESNVLSTFDRCLGCRACEPLCPHHVPYHRVRQVVQELRRDLQTSSSSSSCAMKQSEYQDWMTLAQRIGNAWWRRYGVKWLAYPSSGSFLKKRKRPKANQPILAVCCVQDLFQHEVIEQAIAFMQRLGVAIEVDDKQPCCGAIFERLVQGGQEAICYPKQQRKAALLQNKALKKFSQWLTPQTYFLAMGCQCFVAKQDLPTLNLYTWIETLLDQQQLVLTYPDLQDVYYQSYCGGHKGKHDPILRLLKRIRGLTVRELPNPQACCGGYCGENLLHPQQAHALANQKIVNLPDQAIVVVTSPDCWELFHSLTNQYSFTICYPFQLFSQASLSSIKDVN